MRALLVAVVAAVAAAPLVAAEVSASAECGADGDRVVIDDDGNGFARASCSQSSLGWVPWAGAGGGAVAGLTWAWLAWLRWLPMFGLFTRIRSDRLVDHPLRAQLLEIIEAEPGIHYQALIQRTGRGQGAVAHHLSMLVRAGMLSSFRSPGHRSFFIKGRIDVAVMRGLALVKSDTAGAVLRSVAQRPGVHKRSIARELGCRESAVRYHVRRFEAAGMVGCDGGVHLLPAGEQVLDLLPARISAPTRPPGLMA